MRLSLKNKEHGQYRVDIVPSHVDTEPNTTSMMGRGEPISVKSGGYGDGTLSPHYPLPKGPCKQLKKCNTKEAQQIIRPT